MQLTRALECGPDKPARVLGGRGADRATGADLFHGESPSIHGDDRQQVADLSARLAMLEVRQPVGVNGAHGTNGHARKPEPVVTHYDYVI